jgi:hypothetical protein
MPLPLVGQEKYGLHAVYKTDFVSADPVLSGSSRIYRRLRFWGGKNKKPGVSSPKMGQKRNTGLHAVYRADFVSADPVVLTTLPPTRNFMPRKRVSNQCIFTYISFVILCQAGKQNLLLFFRDIYGWQAIDKIKLFRL